jgi:hypothetical protein
VTEFIPGIELSRAFFAEVVQPILADRFPALRCAAGARLRSRRGMHNALGITEPLTTTVRPFFGRPFRVIALNGFAGALLDQIGDESVRMLLERPVIGGLDQFSDSTDLIENPLWRPLLRQFYQ